MEPQGLMRPISKDEQKEHRDWLSVFLLDTPAGLGSKPRSVVSELASSPPSSFFRQNSAKLDAEGHGGEGQDPTRKDSLSTYPRGTSALFLPPCLLFSLSVFLSGAGD